MMQQSESLFGQNKTRPIQFGSAARSWRRGPAAPAIWPNEVHVWKIYLKAPGLSDYREILSNDERIRASRFRFHTDSDRFIAARSSLRTILARYLWTQPAELEFGLNPFGKPHLACGQDKLGLRFNLSHSHDMALLAVARNRDVGVDIEFRRPDFATDEVAQRFFSRAERNQLGAIAPEQKTEAFFNCWTRKEAYIKARGEGLSFPLDQFDVSFAPDAPPALLGNRRDATEVSRWSFEELSPANGYAAALTVEGNFSRLLLWDFSGADCGGVLI
jgi:4'-phosphopantetheinyl transferase